VTTTLNSTSTGLSLPANGSPFTIASGTTIRTNSGDAIYAGTIGPWYLSNAGTILQTIAGGDAIFTRSGDNTITNLATISGADDGVDFAQPAVGTVANFGTIQGTGTAGAVIGINLGGGGAVTNTGTLAVISGYDYGVRVRTDTGNVSNEGTISGTNSYGVYLDAGGNVTNTGTISGGGGASGVKIAGNIGTVNNEGSISGVSRGVRLTDGGTVTNSGSINGTSFGVQIAGTVGTVANDGTISGTSFFGVYLGASGQVTNSGTSSRISSSGELGVYIKGGLGNVTNDGIINGGTRGGIGLYDSGQVTNHGIIASDGYGISIGGDPGTASAVVNYGTIQGGGNSTGTSTADAYGVEFYGGGAGTVTNAGIIRGSGAGIMFHFYNESFSDTLTNFGSIVGDYGNTAGGYDAVDFLSGAGTVENSGSISAHGGRYGVYLGSGGVVANSGTGSIYGDSYGVRIEGGGSVTNSVGGTIAGAAFTNGVGTLINAGTISRSTGTSGIGITLGDSGNVVNQGVVTGGSIGIFLPTVGGGSIENLAGGTISGNIGVFFQHSSGTADTFTNAGTVVGTSDAFLSTGADRLIVDPGAVFDGNVSGGSGALELASGSSAGTLSGFGTSITNFSSLQFDPAAQWDVAGNAAALTTFAIAGFAQGDTIDVTDFRATGYTYTKNMGLALTNASSGTITLDFQGGSYTTGNFSVIPDGPDGSLITVACYLAGTNILTPSGEVPVETLAIGDLVITRSGQARPIMWIGRRSYDGRFTAGNRDVLPIRIAAGALGDGVPRRDLHVSPKHALWFDGVLIPAEKLVNGVSIHRLQDVATIEYFHIELAAHDVVLAEGAAAETFVDCDNRGMFHNGLEFHRLYPNADPPKWAYCAPLIESGEALQQVRRQLEQRLEALGSTTSVDPALRLLVDGSEQWPDLVDRQTYLFKLTERPNDVRILSHASIPAEVTASTDIRRLGVSLSSLVLRSDHIACMVEHDHPALTDGFHEDEQTHRWTDGDAGIPPVLFGCFGQALTIEVRLLDQGLPYRVGSELYAQGRREGRRRCVANRLASDITSWQPAPVRPPASRA
jgi:hypothetical protein